MIKPDFNKGNGLIAAVVQDNASLQVLMVGYMNEEAFDATVASGKVTFFSRSRNTLWIKGETSGSFLFVKSIVADCDNDTILVKASPAGPVCHTGSYSCFGEESPKGFIYRLEEIIDRRIRENDGQSYTNSLFRKGINKVAQKVGEEAVELVIEAKDDNRDLFTGEAADLLYHLLVLLRAKGTRLDEIEKVLMLRHNKH